MKREEFLIEYLGALGATEVIFADIQASSVSGTVAYDLNDPEERQGFRWHASDADVPSEHACRLACVIHKRSLLHTDRLAVSRGELCSLYRQDTSSDISQDEFDEILKELEEVHVRMVDEGEETDTYFIHE